MVPKTGCSKIYKTCVRDTLARPRDEIKKLNCHRMMELSPVHAACWSQFWPRGWLHRRNMCTAVARIKHVVLLCGHFCATLNSVILASVPVTAECKEQITSVAGLGSSMRMPFPGFPRRASEFKLSQVLRASQQGLKSPLPLVKRTRQARAIHV